MIRNYYSNTTKQHYSNNNSELIVPSDDGTKTIGVIKNGIFTKFNFNSSKHICFKHRAIGLDIGSFNEYIKPKGHLIKCPDRQKGITYTISITLFEAHAVIDNLGWGTQMFCPIKFWTIEPEISAAGQLTEEVN